MTIILQSYKITDNVGLLTQATERYRRLLVA